jgi:hypothetical protein
LILESHPFTFFDRVTFPDFYVNVKMWVDSTDKGLQAVLTK